MTDSKQYGPSPLEAAYDAWWREQQRRHLVEPLWRSADLHLLERLSPPRKVAAVSHAS